MSMNRVSLIQEIFSRTKYDNYLEIGCQTGSSFLPIRAKIKTAVDPRFCIAAEDIEFWRARVPENDQASYFEEESDQFFQERVAYLSEIAPIDLVLIDGLHTFRAALNDVLNSLLYLSDDGIIVMHDCLPPHPAAALNTDGFPTDAELKNVDGWTGEWCGSVWKAIVYLRHVHADLLDVFVIDTDYGLGIVRPKRALPATRLQLDEQLFSRIEKLPYDALLQDPRGLLGIQPSIFVHRLIDDLAIRSFSTKPVDSTGGRVELAVDAYPKTVARPTKLAVIVPTRTDAFLDKLVASLRHSSDPSEYDLIIADNGLSASCRNRYPEATIVDTPDPFSFAVAVNAAVKRSQPGADLFIVNDDIEILTPDVIKSTQKALFLAKNLGIGVVSPVVMSGAVGSIDQTVVPEHALAVTQEPLCFVAVAIPRAVWNALGGLDESFPGYGYEDTDFCRRVAESGWMLGVTKLVGVSHGNVEHSHSSTFLRRFPDEYQKMSSEAYSAFVKKWGPGPGLGASGKNCARQARRIPLEWMPALAPTPGTLSY